jgi:lysophospholipid acyltransferase (LPLAT)-like uncharacterized protein
MTGFKSRYRVDEVPWYWWLPMQAYGWAIGGLVFAYAAFVALTSRVTYTGYALDAKANYIFCFWHQQVFAYNCLSVRFPRLSFFVHPLWYMIPTHVCVRLKGARHLVLGSSGNDGLAAASELAGYIAQGDSTYFNPDGPYGPVGTVRKGALHIAMQSGAPVVGLWVQPQRYISLKGWDRKCIPLPFSRIVVAVAEPFMPDATDLDAACRRLAADMGGTGDAVQQALSERRGY